MIEFTAFDKAFLKIVGAILIVLGAVMGAFFPARDFEPKYRFIGVLIPGTMLLIGLYFWTI
jgi:hypothetical protein